MRLSELIHAVPGSLLVPCFERGATALDTDTDTDISVVTDDSRRVRPGALFVARPGAKGDGADFVSDAVARGAAAIVALPEVIDRARGAVADAPSVKWFACDRPARAVAQLCHAFVAWPSRRLRMAAVTGTNGKTTIASLLRQLLDHAGVRCGLIGTVEVHDGRVSTPSSLTTPGAEEIASAMASMVANECRAVSMETSSHALDQERTAGLDFEVAIFTNLTGDHLDYHGTMDAYASAKAKLFESLVPEATAIVNAMDPAHERMLRDCAARVVRCVVTTDAHASSSAPDPLLERRAVKGDAPRPSAVAEIHATTLAGASITFRGPWGAFRTELPLTGRHNAMNALQAIAAAHAMGVASNMIEAAVGRLRAPPGRLEPMTAPDAPFQVLVDYAHSDDALTNVLTALRPLVPSGGRVITVFGCGGDRDPTKRPRMAAAACRGSEIVVITSDNPRTEQPETIIDQIMAGVPAGDRSRVRREADRARAIRAAIAEARAGDVVLIAGKGHEDYQIIGKTKRHFDDREEARAALEARLAVAVPHASAGSAR